MAWVLAGPTGQQADERPGDVFGPRARWGLGLLGQARHRGPGQRYPELGRRGRRPQGQRRVLANRGPTEARRLRCRGARAPARATLSAEPGPATRAGQPGRHPPPSVLGEPRHGPARVGHPGLASSRPARPRASATRSWSSSVRRSLRRPSRPLQLDPDRVQEVAGGARRSSPATAANHRGDGLAMRASSCRSRRPPRPS